MPIAFAVQVVQKGWKHLFSVSLKNCSKDLHNIMKTCDSFHGNFFDISWNIVSGIFQQWEIIKQSTYFRPVDSFVKNAHAAETKLYINPVDANKQHLLISSSIGQMHSTSAGTQYGVNWGQGGGTCSSLGSNNPAESQWQQSGLLWCSKWRISFRNVPMISMTKICILCFSNMA